MWPWNWNIWTWPIHKIYRVVKHCLWYRFDETIQNVLPVLPRSLSIVVDNDVSKLFTSNAYGGISFPTFSLLLPGRTSLCSKLTRFPPRLHLGRVCVLMNTITSVSPERLGVRRYPKYCFSLFVKPFRFFSPFDWGERPVLVPLPPCPLVCSLPWSCTHILFRPSRTALMNLFLPEVRSISCFWYILGSRVAEDSEIGSWLSG